MRTVAHQYVKTLATQLNPDSLIGIQNGGKLLTDILTQSVPALQNIVTVLPKDPDFRENDYLALREKLDALITGGKKNIFIVESWFGGATRNGIRTHVGDYIKHKRAEGHDVRLTVVFLREQMGYELNTTGGSPIVIDNVNEGLNIVEYRVRMVLGEDVNKIYNSQVGDQTIRIFNDQGKIVSRMKSKTPNSGLQNLTTRQIFIRLMTGELDYNNYNVRPKGK